MKPIKRIVIDLNRPRTNTVQLVQGDTARQIAVVLMLDGMPYDVSADTSDTIVKGVAYIKANGVGGYYEETTTGDDAVTAGDNAYTWIVSLDNHATDVPGMGEIFIRFSTGDGLILHSFPVKLFIDRSSASGGTDPNAPYYQSNSFLLAGAQVAKTPAMSFPVGVDANGKLWTEGGLSDEAKDALLACFEHVAWETPYGQTYLSALETALYTETHLVSITASYDQDRPIYNIDTQEEAYAKIALDLSVTANYSDGTSETVTGYTLSGTLEVGTNTVTVTYEGKTTTISVLVLSYIPAEYQQVEWIGMDGRNGSANDRYIDLGFIPTLTTGLKFRMRATGTQVANFFGIRQTTSGNNNAMLMLSYSSTHKIGVARWGSATELIPYDTDWHDYEIMPNSIKVDGTEYELADPGSGQSITTQTLSLFGVYANVSGTLKWFDGGTHDIGGIFYTYNGTAITGEFVPCYRKSDNAIGVYDRIGETFIAGHGSLNKGSNV